MKLLVGQGNRELQLARREMAPLSDLAVSLVEMKIMRRKLLLRE